MDPRLRDGGIYIVIHFRSTVADAEDALHWGLYHHMNSTVGGRKMHIKNDMGAGYWFYDESMTRGVMRSTFLVGVMRIGYCPPADGTRLDLLVRSVSIDPRTPPAGYNVLTCRTWVLAVVRVFRDNGFVQCPSVSRLEQEVFAWARQNFQDANNAVQPRAVADSSTLR